jgi:hypothetical protein
VIIWLVNRASSNLAARALDRAIAAINRQLAEDFAPWWGMPATLRKAPRGKLPPSERKVQDACVLYLQKEVDDEGTLGYHDKNEAGIPFAVVSTDVSDELGEEWTVTLSHEVLELIGDPQTNLLAMGPDPRDRRRNVFHWFEMCDAVQAQTYAVGGVRVSNFVLPLYFTPGEQSGPNDFLDSGLRSFETAPGGYVGFYDPRRGRHLTFTPEDDEQARRRFAIKQKLGRVRRACRYRATNQERAALLGQRESAADTPLPGAPAPARLADAVPNPPSSRRAVRRARA